jgi:ABC-type spermidine/putrescine transport system permease subunit II
MNDTPARSPLLGLHAGAVLVFLYLPIVTIAILSFHDSTVFALPWQGFTTKWYERAVANPNLLNAFGNSLLLGMATGTVAMVLGTAMALAYRIPFWGKPFVLVVILLPVMTPPIVHGIALSMFWRMGGMPLNLYGSAFVGHLTFVMPFVFLTIFPRVHRFDRSLEEAAMDLGATRTATFWRITFPLMRPGIIAGGVLAFTLSFDEFLRTLFLTSRELTLPLFLWSMVTNDPSPQSSAVATLITLFSVGCLALWSRFASR